MTRLSSPFIYIDTAALATVSAQYIGYKICNDTGANIADAWVRLTTSGAIVTLGTNEDGLYHIGPLAMNSCANVYFYVKASGVTGTTQNQTVDIFNGNPTSGGTLVCGGNVFGYTVEDLLDANANKPISVTVSGDPNACFTVTATGATGTVGSHNNNNITYTPASHPSWPADAYELTAVNIVYTGGPVGGVNDKLFVDGLSSSNKTYTITYTICKKLSVAFPSIMPVTSVSSGSNNNKFGPVDPDDTILLSAMKSVSPTGTVAAGSMLTYTITVSNTGQLDAFGMTLVDSIPANTIYVPGSTTLNGVAVPDNAGPTMPYTVAREIHSPGDPSGKINDGETATVVFKVTINTPLPAGVTSVSNVATYAGTNVPNTNTNIVTTPVCQPPTTANAGPDQTLCTTSPATLAANTPVLGTSAWSIVSGPSTSLSQFSSTAAPAATFTPAGGAGVYTLRWTISSGQCTASTDDVVLTYKAPPTMANAGPDQTLCTTSPATLAANTPSVGTGAWSVVSGPSTSLSQFSSATSPAATFTPASGAGVYTLRWTISNAPCAASTDDVVLTYKAPPTTANAGPDQTLCTTAPATLAANTPAIGAGAWSIVSGPSTSLSQFSSTGSPTATFTPAGGAGVYTLRWTISNAPCAASTDDVVLTYKAPPTTANAGPDQTLCTTSLATLAANTPTIGAGAWSIVSGPSTSLSQFSNAGSPTATFTPAGGAGAYTLRWTISNPPCADSSSDVMALYVGPPTTANAGPDQTLCTTAPATLAANTPTVGTGAWSVVSGPSTSLAQFSSASSPTANFTPAGGAGVYTLRWTISNAPCTASTDDVVLTYRASPTTANAGPDQTLCATSPATLAANTPSVGTGAWSVVSGPSTASSQFSSASSPTATFTPAGGPGAYTLRWTVSNAPCTASTDDVVITVNVCNADLAVTKSVNNSAPKIGDNIVFTIGITNNGPGKADNVKVEDVLPVGLAFVSATASQGSYNSGTGVWTVGTLNVSQSATLKITVKALIACDGVVNTARITASDSPDPNPSNNQASVTLGIPPGPGLGLPPTSEISDLGLGSVLIYNLYTSSVAQSSQDTRINITNISQTSPVAVHLFFVDGATCSVADSYICLTPNQTSSFLASDVDPGTTGYLVAVAMDCNTGCPIYFNCLIGDAFVKLSSGHQANLGAEAISALTTNPAVCDENSNLATLNFNGASYGRLPRVLAIDGLGSRADGNDTQLVINRIGGNLATGASTLTNIFGILYNDVETPLSFTFNPNACQFRSSLSNNFPRTAPRIETFIPAGRTGWMKFYSQNDQAILGAALNLNPNSTTSSGAFNQGHNLHKLTLTSGATLVVPIIPPPCC